MTLLISPATSQAHAITGIQRPARKRPRPRRHIPSNIAAQTQENNKGAAAGVGPGANGLSQGSAMRRQTEMKCIKEKAPRLVLGINLSRPIIRSADFTPL